MKRKIYAIVIDDNRHIHTVMTALAAEDKQLQHLVIKRCFTTCRAALRYLRKHGPVDVVFCDIELKDEDGLKEAPKFFDLTAFFLLITVHKQFMEEAWARGVHGYIVKPIDPKQIRKKLDDLERIWRTGRVMEDPDQTTFIKDTTHDAPTKVTVGDVISITVANESPNHLCVTTTRGVLRPLASLAQYKKQWMKTGLFAQLSQSVLVSKLHISKIDGNRVHMDNGYVYEVSHRNAHILVELQAYLNERDGSD